MPHPPLSPAGTCSAWHPGGCCCRGLRESSPHPQGTPQATLRDTGAAQSSSRWSLRWLQHPHRQQHLEPSKGRRGQSTRAGPERGLSGLGVHNGGHTHTHTHTHTQPKHTAHTQPLDCRTTAIRVSLMVAWASGALMARQCSTKNCSTSGSDWMRRLPRRSAAAVRCTRRSRGDVSRASRTSSWAQRYLGHHGK